MRLSLGLVLGLALGTQAKRLAARQNGGLTSAPPMTTPAPGGTGSGSGSSGSDSSTTSISSSVGGGGGGGNGGDTTVQQTRTVTQGGGGSTVSQTTTIQVSTVTTVTVTTTDIATTTVTSRDNDTATKTVYVTSTQFVNAKRDLEVVEFVGNGPAQVEAEATPVPRATATRAGYTGLQRFRNNRRAVVTNTVFVTVGSGGGDTTVVVTATRSVRSTTTTLVHTTSFVTETDQANAKTTITSTSTIVLKLTQVSTGAIETSEPTGAGNGNGNGSGNNNADSGLSTGAKAGIGAGVGVVGLAVIAGIIAFCLRRRRRGPKPDPDDLLGPSSEVPVGVGAGGSRSSRPMSEALSSAPGAVPRRSPVLPNVQPEGYRGTAMGDGRAGYAKPETYGSAYAPTRSTTTNTKASTLSPGDQLPRHPTPDTNTASVSPLTPRPDTAELGSEGGGAKWHQPEAAEMATDNPAAAKWHSDNAHEIDSRPAMSHQSGPVYEMPTQSYK
ncbi:hypothetical protein QQS21_003311 [Conoideocrella luteorostrata]|uniref:Uncharacterized protein n=1 Tax=Conoideocrella luteorostrata TaxID=1105319 RepID=A0AAJ0CUE8_9HYPO|nr:hypothetical protein QQS21_003311 [Conoideocrella luteorostrata]